MRVKRPYLRSSFNKVTDQFQGCGLPDIVGTRLEGQSQHSNLQPFQIAAKPGLKLLQREPALAVVDRRNCPQQPRFESRGMCQVLERTDVLGKAGAAIANPGVNPAARSFVESQPFADCVNRGADGVAKGRPFR